MKILSFDKPAKVLPSDKHHDLYVADGCPPGAYVPNMSDDDCRKYKAKIVGGEVPRLEVRVTLGSQILIKVKNRILERIELKKAEHLFNRYCMRRDNAIYEHGAKNIKISMNGPVNMTYAEWDEFKSAIDEAIEVGKKVC